MKDPKRNILRKRIAPGIWEDAAGNPHISIKELLEIFDLPDTEENRKIATQNILEVVRKHCPDATIVQRDTPED